MQFFRKLNQGLAYDPAFPLVGIHPRETIYIPQNFSLNIYSGVIHTSHKWKQSKCLLMGG